MTNHQPLFLILLFLSFHSFSQGVGKLSVSADLSDIVAYDPSIEISVINIASNREVLRDQVKDEFNFSFPLNGKFLLYFRKEGFATTRLMVDTHTFLSGIYSVNFNIFMENSNSNSGIPIGTIKFDARSESFGYKTSNLLASKSVKVTSSIRESEVISF